MTELSQLVSRLERDIQENAPCIRTIKYPELLVSSLKELNSLIGNDSVKDSVATQISYLITVKEHALEDPNVKEDQVMLNTVLYGPPGVGKTLIGSKLAKIWYSLGFLDGSANPKDRKQELKELLKDLFKDGNPISTTNSNSNEDTALTLYIMFVFIVLLVMFLSMTWNFYSKFGGTLTLVAAAVLFFVILLVGVYVSSTFSSPKQKDQPIQFEEKKAAPPENLPEDQFIKVVTRADFVDKYVGWSDKKTVKLLQENLGKVLFVDEAYSLVTDMHDTFGMEVLTAMNLFLSQHPNEIIIIFAGYRDLMETGLFSFQPGLKRRFMWQFDCSGYTEDQMFDIFKMQLKKTGWSLTDNEATKELFKKNKDAFTAFGGDTERLAFFSKLEHSRDKNYTGSKNLENGKLLPVHVSRGINKLRENNIESGGEATSNNPLVNMMKMLKGGKGGSDASILNQMKDRASNQAHH